MLYFEVAKVDIYARLIWGHKEIHILIANRLILDLASSPHAATMPDGVCISNDGWRSAVGYNSPRDPSNIITSLEYFSSRAFLLEVTSHG
jgi:hypothetical protein